ncbi:hypothetical protein KEM52_003737 [Ascosphaera acerosa]|nr:hypothetical protein KEM52_003737 [Ascosphaera acerosa]
MLVISLSHALYDGWSLGLLHEDVRTAYQHLEMAERPSYLPFLEHILKSSSEDAPAFWRGALSGYAPTTFPAQREGHETAGRTHRLASPMAIGRSHLLQFCKHLQVSPQAVCIACWSLVLAGYLRRLDVVCGTVMSGRDSQTAEAIMFPTFNTVAFRSILHGEIGEFTRYTQDMVDSMRDYQHFPLRKARRFAQGMSDELPLFDSLVIYQRSPEPAPDTTIMQPLYHSVRSDANVEIPICAEMEVVGQEVVWRIACQDRIMKHEDAQALLHRIEEVFTHMITESTDEVFVQVSDTSISVCNSRPFKVETLAGFGHVPTRAETAVDYGTSGAADVWVPSDLEEKIRDVVASVAGVPPHTVLPDQTIYHLGLDSISAIKVSSLLRQQSVLLSVSELVRAGTVPAAARLARTMDEGEVDWRRAQLPGEDSGDAAMMAAHLHRYGLTEDGVQYVCHATAGQTYLLAAHDASGGRLFYPCFAYEMVINTCIPRNELQSGLAIAWQSLVEKFPILRTAFVPADAGTDQACPYVQVCLAQGNSPIRWLCESDLRAQTSSCESCVAGAVPVTLYAAEAAQRQSLDHQSESRDGKHHGQKVLLVLRIHHALYDAMSLPLMMRELELLVNRSINGQEQDAMARRGSCIDMRHLTAYLSSVSRPESRRQFWQTYLAGLGCDEEAAATATGAVLARTRDTARFVESLLSTTGPTAGVARRHGISLQSVFLACFARVWQALLHGRRERAAGVEGNDAAGPTTVVVGLYLSNRGYGLNGVEEMVAPTLNIVPLRIDLSGDGATGTGRAGSDSRSVLMVAAAIQKDLQMISSEENGCASLLDIKRWTGVTVDVFVNFRRDEDGMAGARTADDRGGCPTHASIRPLAEAKASGLLRPDDAAASSGSPRREPTATATARGITAECHASEELLEVYAPGIDVEAAVREGGRLDVGVFGLCGEDSDRVLRGLSEELEAVAAAI